MKRIAIQQKHIVYSFKIVIIGGPAVGKTCLFNRFCFNSFNFDSSMTIGLNFHSLELPLINPEDSELSTEFLVSNSIFDFGGQDRFKPLIPKFLRGADGAILVFDLLNEKSLEKLNFWYDELVEYAKGDRIPKLLVGSKSDLISKVDKELLVKDKNIQEFLIAKNLNGYFKTSALENYNVVKVFKKLNELMLFHHDSQYVLL